MSADLRTLSLVFALDGLRVQARYVRRGKAPNPGTKARAREVRELVRAGLSGALRSFDASGAEVAVTQEAGFENRVDTLKIEGTADV